jgi:hypothetical protein
MTYLNPTLKVADTEAELAAGTGYECQITSAVISASVTFQTIPPTGCAGPSQSPSAPTYSLTIDWLQDWSAPGGGLSKWAEDHAGLPAWVELVPNTADAATKATGPVTVVPGSFGGTFGDGSAGMAGAPVWGFTDRPTFVVPADVLADEAEAA